MGKRSNRRGVPARARSLEPRVPPAGTHLGDLSPDVEELDVTFTWFGAEVRVNPELSDLAAVDFAEKAFRGGLDEDDPRVAAVIKDEMRLFVHPDDFDEFWGLALRNRVGTQQLMQAMHKLLELIAGRPTGRSTGSPDGPRHTRENSKDDSSSPVIRRMEQAGRADLALVYVQADEARATA